MQQLQPSGKCGVPSATAQQDTTVGPASELNNSQLGKIQVGIEVSLTAISTASFDDIKQRLQTLLSSRTLRLREGQLHLPTGEDGCLDKHVQEVCVTTDGLAESHIGRSFFAWELDISIRYAAAACIIRSTLHVHATCSADR
jgi:hypothetical protein